MFASRFRLIKTVAVTAAVAVFALPAFTPFVAGAQAKKVLQYGWGGEPNSIDPQYVNDVENVDIDTALFRSLLRYDKNGVPAPSIAKDVPTVDNGGISKDGKTYTYHLRQDWKWSDGNGVVKAQDIVYSWQRLVNPKLAAGYGSFFDGLLLNADTINNSDPAKVDQKLLDSLGVKAIDDWTVQFTLVHPAGYWNDIATMWVGSAVRKDNVERTGNGFDGTWADPSNGPVVGSGPFILSKWDHNKVMVLTKNPNFAGDAAKLDEVDLQLIQDAQVQLTGFTSGQLDLAGFPGAEYKSIKADPKLGVDWKAGKGGLLTYPSTCTTQWVLDNTRPPFNNRDVRLAFAYAFDRDTYIHVIANDLATKWLSFLPPGYPQADPKLGSDYDFNPDKAKAALAKAGFKDGKGFPTVNYHYSAGANGQRQADFIQAMYKKYLNITINQDAMDSAVFLADFSNPTTKLDGMYRLGWCQDYPHPSDWFIPVFGGMASKAGNGNNSAGYNNPKFEKIAAQADSTLDPTAADALYKQAHQILIDDQPDIFAYVSLNTWLVSSKITNMDWVVTDGGYPGSYFWEYIDIAS